jgi:6-phosphogluconolactonase (cycloisomerase 2 family)
MHRSLKTPLLGSIATFALVAAFTVAPMTISRPALHAQEEEQIELSPDLLEQTGEVYVMTNQTANAIAGFRRAPNGRLIAMGTVSTGGAGNPVAPPPGMPTDPLSSQGALILHGNFLFAVNAGSNEISVLSLGHIRPRLVHKVSSGGTRPISLTAHGNRLYVLNEGGTPNITGFTFDDDGRLSPLSNSTRPLSGAAMIDPAQVSFSPDGELLVVTEKNTSTIDVYSVGADGRPTGPMVRQSNGMTPFGFAFADRASLIVSEAFGGMPNQSAVSSYRADASANLNVVSGSVPDTQTAACWIVIGNDGRHVFTSNTASGTVSSYNLRRDGVLTLLNPIAANLGASSSPIDMALEKDGRHMYVHAAGSRAIVLFRLERDGQLVAVSTAGRLPLGAQGIAAR